MAKIKDLGITICPPSMYAGGDDRGKGMTCEENTGSECGVNDTTCGGDGGGDEGGDDQGKPPKPKKYYAFSPELVSQFKQQLDSHLGM